MLVQRYESWQRRRFAVPPGITGWWQINGRSERMMHLHTEDDLYYVQHYSIWLDLQILLKTGWTVLRGRGASYIVGTPKAMLRQFERYMLDKDWHEVQARGFKIGPVADRPQHKTKAVKLMEEGQAALRDGQEVNLFPPLAGGSE